MSSIVSPNRLLAHLREDRTAVGCMVVELRQPSVMQLLANALFDFVLIDNEHGPFTVETIADLCRAARLVGLTPIVRVPALDYAHITQSLDGGAQGIMLPRVTHESQAAEAVAMMKYPPMGRRGAVLARGHTAFRGGPLMAALEQGNRETMLVVQIETRESVERLEQIAAVPGVDALLIGPTDLSVALGVGGDMDSPVLHEAIQKTIDTCRKHKIIPGIHTNEVKWSAHWAKQGMRLVSINSEIGFLMKAGREAADGVRGAT
jgi:2-dehydro-3-deoxyglucarate aldolase/4-hydroxy-2-oxoheptanedioate aldolase